MAFWVILDNDSQGCVDLGYADRSAERAIKPAERAIELAERATGKKVVDWWTIPYPATPLIVSETNCPTFCYDPKGSCRGKSSCPKRFACSE